MKPDPLDTTFAALADPTRRAILARLALGDANPTELAQPFDMSLPAISKHLKVLERAGLISRGHEAQARPCHLEAARLREATVWIERYRRFLEQQFTAVAKRGIISCQRGAATQVLLLRHPYAGFQFPALPQSWSIVPVQCLVTGAGSTSTGY